jgi:hypothetical protein
MASHHAPSAHELDQLLDRLLAFDPISSLHLSFQELLRYLFEQAKKGRTGRITVPEMEKECKGGPPTQKRIGAALSQLGKCLKRYFDQRRGTGEHAEWFRAEIQANTHLLVFSPNTEECPALRDCWGSYFQSLRATYIYYAEPLFFRLGPDRYLRQLSVNTPEDRTAIRKFLGNRARSKKILTSTSYVQSGVVAAMTHLLPWFAANGAPMRFAVARAIDESLPHHLGNAIVLTSPSANARLIQSLDHDLVASTRPGRARSQKYEIHVGAYGPHKKKVYTDEVQEEESADGKIHLRKWALVTRRSDADTQQVTTMIIGHSRAVQGAVTFLTSEKDVQKLKQKFGGRLPSQYQIVFRVRVRKESTSLDVTATAVERVISLDDRGTVVSARS